MTSRIAVAACLGALGVAGLHGPVDAAARGRDMPVRLAAATPLGDLAAYRTITADTLVLVDKGNLVDAEKRGTDLETAWDQAEDRMKPTDPKRWRVIDKAIDRVLHELRAPKPQGTACAAALKDLIDTIDRGGTA